MDGSPAPLNEPVELTAVEARVLGCLIEKEATTPDNYPLTLNSVRNACNQSTSRDPVVDYGDHEVESALASLRERGITRTVHSTSNRATKFRHVVPELFGVDEGELAVLAVLLLRGAQTVGELKTRAERQHGFDTTDEVAAVLRELSGRGFAHQLERKPGQKDARWVQLLSPVADAAQETPPEAEQSTDPYAEATAEFYDLLATGHWEYFGLQLIDLLADVDPSAGPIVDVGCGTGVGLPYLHAAVPEAEIFGIEPSQAMRTALHTRLALDEHLRAVTTVDPRTLAEAALPPRACALIASAAIGHFAAAERTRLWNYIATALPPGAPAVIEVLPPRRPETIPPTRYRRLEVGRYVYEGWQQGEPADEAHMSWTMTYRVLDGEHELSSSTVTSRWRCFDVADIRDEIASHGLELVEHDDCVVVSART